ncbi:hypothetical protein CXK86_20480 [Paenibacillus sp. BGI2013]|uniref:hypothetical protein n=1 Tax=Paenibacillus sp. BGI2013 TaxID=2058902 RepID=UPI000C6DF9DB|nr:hypothetical protein [Paenibacillus sp. BGI2013]PKQ89425.1 hypothetical protein CXK86_20480 [Paenibacillus sp. BGI2013]
MKQKRFQKELKSILFFVLEYGIKSLSFKMTDVDELKRQSQATEFISKVHKGFMQAQNLILQNLLLLGEEKKKTKERIKELNKLREDKDIIQVLKEKVQIIEYQENVLRKVADTIAWQILKSDITVIRRLYNFSAQVEIYNSNLEHDLEVVQEIFETDNERFPLITDITSFIQVGDLLIRDRDKINILELKEGKVNEQISDILKEHLEVQSGERKLYYELENKDDKFRKQFLRYVKQEATALNTIQIINEGEGTDSLGRNIKIIDNVFYTEHFTDTIQSMLEEVNKKNYSINYIEDCLAVGVYNSTKIPMHYAFDAWKKGIGIDFPTVDIRGFFNNPVGHPLFLHPFNIDDKVKLVTGEKLILMSLNIHAWLKKFEGKNVNARLLSKKETAKFNNTPKHSKAFEYNGQAIEIEQGNIKQIVFGGIFERMFNQFQKPSSLVDFISMTLDKGKLEFSEERGM